MRLFYLLLVVALLPLPSVLRAEEGGQALDLTPPGGRNVYPELPEIKKYKPVARSDDITVTDLEYGVFQNRLTLEANETMPASDLEEFDLQTVSYKEREPVTETSFIPAKVGVKFGLRYQLTGPGARRPVPVKLLFLTPGLRNPETGKYMDKIEITQELNPRSRYHVMAFQFAESWEITAGAWHLYVFHEDRKLIHKTFTVVK